MNPVALPLGTGPQVPLGDRIRADIGRRTDTFAQAASRVRGEQDPEAVHDLRVSVRRLSAVLTLWRDALRGRAVRRGRLRLRTLRRAVGATRETEVHIADLSHRLRDQPLAIRLVGADLLDVLRREVRRGRERAIARCSEVRVTRILRGVRRALGALDAREAAPERLLDAARERVDAAARTAREHITTALSAPGDEPLHAARIAVKQWRYALEAFAATGVPTGVSPADLRPLQEALGAVQDRATLRSRIGQFAADLQDRGLLVHSESLRPLMLEIEAERRAAVDRFTTLAAALLEPAEPARADGEGAEAAEQP